MIPNDKFLTIANTLFKQRYGQSMYSYQEILMHTRDQNRIYNKSRQMGFSDGLSCQHLLDALFNNTTELVVSPSQRQSNHLLDYAYEWLNLLRKDFNIKTIDESQSLISFESGGYFYSLPNSASTVRGIKADHITLDEFAHFKNGTDKEIKEAILPSTSRGGSITYNSTPFGDKNEYYNLWENTQMLKVTANWRQCPDLKKEKILQIRGEIGEDAFLQEYENKFLSDFENQEFPMELIQSCIDPELSYQELKKDITYYGGADIGRERDLTAFVALQKENDTYTLRKKETLKQTPYKQQLAMFQHYLNNYNFTNFIIDESGIGNMLAEELKNKYPNVEAITFNNENKQELVANLKSKMQNKNLVIPDDPQLVNSIRAIRRIYTPSNYLRFDSDRDSEIGHADLFWALALAVKQNQSWSFRYG